MESRFEADLRKLKCDYYLETTIALLLNIEDLHVGSHVIRNEKGWRDNERKIEYSWTVRIWNQILGEIVIFCVKFAANKFRDIDNPEELVQGLLNLDANQNIDNHYAERYLDGIYDEFHVQESFKLFECNPNIILDGTSYDLHIIAQNINSRISFYESDISEWKAIELIFKKIGKKLSEGSNNQVFIDFFRL
jgi:hypothetical protein